MAQNDYSPRTQHGQPRVSGIVKTNRKRSFSIGTTLPPAASSFRGLSTRAARSIWWQPHTSARIEKPSGEQFSVCEGVKDLGYRPFGVVVLYEVGLAAS